jgi:hypothetical protein
VPAIARSRARSSRASGSRVGGDGRARQHHQRAFDEPVLDAGTCQQCAQPAFDVEVALATLFLVVQDQRVTEHLQHRPRGFGVGPHGRSRAVALLQLVEGRQAQAQPDLRCLPGLALQTLHDGPLPLQRFVGSAEQTQVEQRADFDVQGVGERGGHPGLCFAVRRSVGRALCGPRRGKGQVARAVPQLQFGEQAQAFGVGPGEGRVVRWLLAVGEELLQC